MTTDVINGVPRDWLKQLHRDLDACQKLIWANLRGCDPAYCADAQARLAEIETMLATAQPAADGERESCSDCNGLGFGPFGGCGECDGSGQARAAQPQQAVAVTDVSTLKIALTELHKCGVKPGSLAHMVLTNLIDAAHKTGEEE